MNENASSNISQILTSFETFIKTYNNPQWIDNITSENIKSTFKLGLFIEKCILKFRQKDYTNEFMKVLEIWCMKKNINAFDEHFFIIANDKLLEKVFKQSNVKETTLDVCVRIYCSIYPSERFQNFLKNLILTSSSVCGVVDFVNENIHDHTCIRNMILLNHWFKFIFTGEDTTLISEIENYISLYKVEDKLPLLFSVLNTKDDVGRFVQVKATILSCIIHKMSDRSLLSKNFWVTLFKKVKREDIGLVVNDSKEFLDALLSFIEYAGPTFQRNGINKLEWKSNPRLFLYPEIEYLDILYLLKTVIALNNTNKQYLSDRLDQVEEDSNTNFWSELKHELFMNI